LYCGTKGSEPAKEWLGVRIGDSTAKMREALGEPVKTLKPPLDAYLYYIDDRTTARFDVDGDNKIVKVFLLK
jgi:hypothetical protein